MSGATERLAQYGCRSSNAASWREEMFDAPMLMLDNKTIRVVPRLTIGRGTDVFARFARSGL